MKEYEGALENNSNSEHVGVTEGKRRIVRTYDITVDNETSLYLLSNCTLYVART